MAQYYQIQNLEELKQIYADVQVVHVASEDVGVGGHNRPQQLLLPDDQLMLNEGQQVVYQTTSVPTQQQYQQQPTATTTQYIIGDEISQQQQQQTVQHQQVMYDHHHQQQQQHYVHESQQLQQDHHQLAQQTQQQQPQLYYTTEQILQPNSLVQQQQQQEMQHQQQQQQQLHVQQQQYQQQQQQQQQIVHQQHSMQTPQQTQQIVYRMQPQQQSQNQQTQMLNNAHVILQQPSGQQVLIQSPQHPEIIMRQSMPQQRIIYNTNRVLYTPQQQQQPQTQTILQQSPQAHQQHPQQQQHIQLQATPTTSPIHTTARLVQTRVGASPQETAQQHQQTPTQQNVVFHPIQATTVQNPQQLKPQIQQQSQMTIQQTPQQHLVASTMSGGVSGGGVMRGAIRNKSPRGGSALGSTHTLIARMPVTTVGRAIRPPLVTPIQSPQNPRATRPRGGAAGGARARGTARGARGGAVIASRNTQVATPVVQPQQQSQQLQAQQQITPSQQIMQNAMNKNITILNQQGQVKHVYRNIGDSQQQQLQLVTGTSQTQQRSTQIVGARFRTPVVSTSGNTNNGNNSSSSGNSSGNYELDLEDSIQAVVVKKDQQKPPVSTSNIANPVGTTLTSYFAKDDDDTRLVRTQNGACITLAEYRKRHPPNPGSASTTTTTILQMKTPLRASGPPSSNKILPAHSSGNTGIVPVARVAPQPIQSAQQTQQSQTALTTTTSSSAVHRTSHNNYEIHTQHVMQNRNNTQMAEKDRNSAKMLVILVSGEQRLITFTLPRESCTVQDLLEQVGVPFDSSTTIQCVENPGANIDFVVTVGFSVQESASELISRAEQTLQMNRQQDPMGGNNLSTSNTSSGGSSTGNTNVPQGTVGQSTVTTNYGNVTSNPAQTPSAVVNESTHKDANSSNAAANTTKNSSSSSTNTTEDVPRKIIQGFLAVCQSCGFSGYDHAKCERCKRVFLEPPKRVPSVKNLGNNNASMAVDSTLSKSISNSEFMASDKRRGSDALARSQAKNALNSYGSTGSTASARGRGGLGATARGRGSRSGRRTAEVEPVILTLSSDEEDDDESSNKVSGSFSTMSNAASSSAFKTPTYEPLSFEHSMPDLDENAIYADFQRDDVTDLSNCTDKLSTALQCKVVRIGTYRYEPKEPVTFTSKGVCLVAPLVNNPNDSFPLHIHKREVVKIIAHFSKVSESMLCFYTLRNCAQYIKNSLQMKDNGTTLDGSAYFSPNGPYQVRKIILQFSSCSDQSRNVIKSIWDFFDEISDVDAQDLLQRAEATDRQISNKTNETASTTCVTTTQLNPNEIKQLLIYPPGKGGISINTEDYLCLATDQYLNDIIIDFYLKWVHNNVVPEAQRERAFIFSTFFYKRLTTLTRHHHNPDKDVKQTAAQKRHARVQNWTKNVNLFEKDFIIIPINEQSHWFLAIICFPTMKGPVTYDTNIPVEPQQLKKQKGKKVSLQIGNTTITPLSKRDSSTMLAEVCGVGDDDSERDEAEGDESDLASDDSDFDSGASTSAVSATISGGVAAANNSLSNSNTSISGIKSQAIKQPLILIFDSLAGASRSRVVATLRDYLTCEYRAKMSDVTPHVFNKDNMPGHCVKVPQQNNFTDCGLYLLQYVEHFFKDPIRDYRLPIKQLSNWFDTLTVTRKREDISQLLQQLMNERNGPNHQVILPEIPLPTSNGQLVEPPEGYNIEFEEEETGEEAAEEDDDNTDVDGTPNDADGTASSTHTDELVSVKMPTTKTATTTTALVPTQGRKIVVKRRLQQVSSATVSNNNSENLNTTTSVVAGVAGQNIRSGNQAKYRKFE